MRKSILLITALLSGCNVAFAQDAHPATSAMSCPPGYALRIDPVPPPADDPAQPAQPKSAAEKQQEQQQALADEMARWHCVPMTNGVPQQ